MNQPLTERYAAEIVGGLSCFDRIVVLGTLPEICHAGAMESLLRSRGVRLFDYTQALCELGDGRRGRSSARCAAGSSPCATRPRIFFARSRAWSTVSVPTSPSDSRRVRRSRIHSTANQRRPLARPRTTNPFSPASAAFSTWMICSSVNRLFRIVPSQLQSTASLR
jgi:hypothetical protein